MTTCTSGGTNGSAGRRAGAATGGAPVPDPAGSLARLLSLEREVETQHGMVKVAGSPMYGVRVTPGPLQTCVATGAATPSQGQLVAAVRYNRANSGVPQGPDKAAVIASIQGLCGAGCCGTAVVV